MTDPEILKQYDGMGEDYVRNQRIFFSGKEDWTRVALREKMKEYAKETLLDIGCGAGDDVKWAEELGMKIQGVDPSETMCNLAKKNVQYPKNIQIGDFDKLPFPDSHFDLIISRFALHYLHSFEEAYQEIARVLKPGGEFLFVVSHPTFDMLQVAHSQETLVKTVLYNGVVTVVFPAHTFEQYFSKTFLNLFNLTSLRESASLDAENPLKVPETLLYAAKKREKPF